MQKKDQRWGKNLPTKRLDLLNSNARGRHVQGQENPCPALHSTCFRATDEDKKLLSHSLPDCSLPSYCGRCWNSPFIPLESGENHPVKKPQQREIVHWGPFIRGESPSQSQSSIPGADNGPQRAGITVHVRTRNIHCWIHWIHWSPGMDPLHQWIQWIVQLLKKPHSMHCPQPARLYNYAVGVHLWRYKGMCGGWFYVSTWLGHGVPNVWPNIILAMSVAGVFGWY